MRFSNQTSEGEIVYLTCIMLIPPVGHFLQIKNEGGKKRWSFKHHSEENITEIFIKYKKIHCNDAKHAVFTVCHLPAKTQIFLKGKFGKKTF